MVHAELSCNWYDLAYCGRIIGLVVYLFDTAHAGTIWTLVGLRYAFRPWQGCADVDCIACVGDARWKVLLEVDSLGSTELAQVEGLLVHAHMAAVEGDGGYGCW